MTNLDAVKNQLQSQIQNLDTQIKSSQALLTDPQMKDLATQEINSLQTQKQALLDSIASLQDQPADSPQKGEFNSNQITLEVRPGAGGEEAKIWASDLLRMYTRFAQNNKFTLESIDEGVLKIKGQGVYSLFKYESGVHRVQRVPTTESQGRIHTSTASVAVLPIIPREQLEIKPEDLDWQFYRSGGKGGQNVNKVNTAVRLTHRPSGLVVTCSSERSQEQNRAIALDMIRSQLWEQQEEQRLGTLEEKRRAAVGRAMRAEKIKTYNYPGNRLTDHRINESWHNLDSIMEGNLSKVLAQVNQKMLPAPHQNTKGNTA